MICRESLVKHHEPRLKHCEESLNARHSMRQYWRSMRRRRRSTRRCRRSRGVTSDIGDIGNCSVGVTPQMCNRVTNRGDMGTFSRPASQDDPDSRFPGPYLHSD